MPLYRNLGWQSEQPSGSTFLTTDSTNRKQPLPRISQHGSLSKQAVRNCGPQRQQPTVNHFPLEQASERVFRKWNWYNIQADILKFLNPTRPFCKCSAIIDHSFHGSKAGTDVIFTKLKTGCGVVVCWFGRRCVGRVVVAIHKQSNTI